MGIAVNRKRIGIIGGSFDPIHKGHLETAEFVYQQLGLEKIIFIPAYIAPHKIGMEYALAEHRYQMTLLAIQDNPHFCVSDIELKRKGVSYTYDTIAALHEYYGDGYELYFIIGADSVAELDTWIKVREIMALCTFVAATRPGFAPEVKKVIEYFGELGRTKIKWLNTPEMDISSTDIRQRVQDNCSITGLVPAQVEEYIHQKGLYRS
ncbi:MAG: nicotinate-nucleotide adenylyltransferase [Acidaminococcaceae bacterium]